MTKAVILAAGRGSRLSPYTDDRPKCQVEFAGRPLIAWQLDALAAAGVEVAGIVTGYRGDRLEALGMRTWLNPDWGSTNMIWSLLAARLALEAGDDLIVAYSDIVYEPSVIETLLAADGDIATVVDDNWLGLWQARAENPLDDAESLRIDDSGCITDIGRKVADIAEIEAQYIGISRFSAAGSARALSFLDNKDSDGWLGEKSLRTCYMTDFLLGMIKAGIAVQAARISSGWIEFDTVEDLELYQTMWAAGTLSKFVRMPEGGGSWLSG